MISLPELYNRILLNTAKVVNLPAIEDESQLNHTVQELVTECLKDLRKLHSQLIELSMFSPNDHLDDISTQDLIYLSVPYIFSEVQGRVNTPNRVDRLNSLVLSETYLKSFLSLLEQYEIVPAEERTLYDRKVAQVADPAKRRDLKINQYRKEKELVAKIQASSTLLAIGRRRSRAHAIDVTPTDYELISSLLPNPKLKEEEELDSEMEEVLRETSLLLLRLLFVHASTQLQSMVLELELLRNAPPSPTIPPVNEDERYKRKKAEDDAWKLDIPVGGGPDSKGPLMDLSGKPLRPFTILPSGGAERASLQSQVFGPGHRLPTMSIDEYLEIERQRGNILTGGGAASQEAPTSFEQLAIASEMDGTAEGEIKTELKRQKEENWALYTEANPRGAGNTMNRG
ncbi:serine/threonine protein phosphatase PP2A-associated protein [Pholiota conissans]|uniref:Serine/threonine protein phosphatase PP2A-associated protein n=1 Tax=Pholiota conissans TaxID=109636 RepID=A0A9P6D4S0_9AGAR|nr:serine/threonine protein phosphatase PP2A-associated protein [Pholiota conissans]